MEIQRVWAAYFSPTGTTEKIVTHLAEHLAKPIEHPVLYFDFTLPPARQEAKRFLKSDLVVFGVPVYAGMVVGETPKSEDITVNICKKKQLTNMRAAGSDDALRLTTPRQMSLEQCLEFLADDELLEVTPENLRLRKRILSHADRMKALKGNK